MMIGQLQKQQEPIDREIAKALAEAVPEHWTSIRLVIKRMEDDTLCLEIFGPSTARERIGASTQLCDLAYQLLDLFNAHGTPWHVVTYDLEFGIDGSLAYNAKFSY